MFRVGAGRHDGEVAIDGIGDEGLAAVQHPAVAVALCVGSDARHIGARVRFAHGDREDRLAREDAGHEALELFGRARVHDVGARHVGVHEHGHVEAREGRGAQGLGEGRRCDRAEPDPAQFFGHAQAQHAEGAHLTQHFAGHLPGFFPRFAVGDHLVGDEVACLLDDRFEFVGHVGVAMDHVSLSSSSPLPPSKPTSS